MISKVNRDIRIGFLGESFVNGTGDRTYLGWTGRVCQTLSQQGYQITHYNLGIRRETSTELLQRWQAECDRRFPVGCDNRLVFCFGVNDTTLESGKPRVDPAQSMDNTRQILSRAKEKYSVLMISSAAIPEPEQNERIRQLTEQLSLLCDELTIPFLDVFTPLSRSQIWLQEAAANDGYHPDAAGYTEFAQLVQTSAVWHRWFT
ncbi:MAG TPA: GDSL-type esterase/lipase family protein [Microcoleaceae cyanobacterium]